MTTIIHPTAVVDSGAVIGEDCTIGPFCNIGPKVVLGNRVNLVSNVTINGKTSIGNDSVVYPFAVLGQQDEFTTKRLSIGKKCNIREYVTISDGTVIGDDCQVGVNSHVGHSCKIGNNVVLSNLIRVVGDVEIEDNVVLSGRVTVLDFLHIGCNAFVAGMTIVDSDVVPYSFYEAIGGCALYRTINNIGLQRCGFADDDIQAIHKVYSSVFGYDIDSNLLMGKLNDIEEKVKNNQHAMYAINFLKNSFKRGKLKTEKWSRKQYKTGRWANCADLKNDGATVEDLNVFYEVFNSICHINNLCNNNLNDVREKAKNNKYAMYLIDFIENRSKRGI